MVKKIGVKRSFLYRITIPVILIIILCYFMQTDFGIEIIFGENLNTPYLRNYETTTFFANDGSGWIAFFTCFTFLYPLYWLTQWFERCPKCKCWSANEVIEKKWIDSNSSTSNFSETTSHKDFNDKNVYTTKHYEKTVTTTYYDITHKCKFCNHLWFTKKTEDRSAKVQV